jgi:hypothetical protein
MTKNIWWCFYVQKQRLQNRKWSERWCIRRNLEKASKTLDVLWKFCFEDLPISETKWIQLIFFLKIYYMYMSKFHFIFIIICISIFQPFFTMCACHLLSNIKCCKPVYVHHCLPDCGLVQYSMGLTTAGLWPLTVIKAAPPGFSLNGADIPNKQQVI